MLQLNSEGHAFEFRSLKFACCRLVFERGELERGNCPSNPGTILINLRLGSRGFCLPRRHLNRNGKGMHLGQTHALTTRIHHQLANELTSSSFRPSEEIDHRSSMASVQAKLLMMFLLASWRLRPKVGKVRAQSCSTQMAGLNVCAPFVMPGTSKGPSTECCGALQAVEHDCLCSTLRVATSLPSACHLLLSRVIQCDEGLGDC
ncbi:uncharacterized protein J3R85_010293 [Psidium guajava]|nr:uncharacterized protein J3R85_010293 [Psidium guajava]